MPAGLKQSSSVVSIGFSTDESAPNTFSQAQVDLNLSPLDREVFVVLAVNLDPFTPDALAGIDTKVESSLTTTRQTAVHDFFVQVQGTGNAGGKGADGKLYGYRATASADIFAALVQSEVLSA